MKKTNTSNPKSVKDIVWIVGTRVSMSNSPTSEQRNTRFWGHPHPATGFGIADGQIVIHAEQFYIDPNGEPVPEQGVAPYFVDLKLNGNPYRTAGPFPNCLNPSNTEEINILIEDLPHGDYSMVVRDSTPSPDGPLDARASSGFDLVSPPYGRLRGLITPPGNSPLTVWFEFGLTSDYGRIAQAGIVTGEGTFLVEIRLSAKVDEGSPTEYLEPGKTYHFRVGCTDGTQPWYGEDLTFQTERLPVAKTIPAIIEN